jgi:PAS domain S-box-containing protein
VTAGLFLASIGIRTASHRVLQQQKVGQQASIISESLWSFNPDVANDYLYLTCTVNHYKKMVVSYSSDQEFISIDAPRDRPMDRFFESIALIRTESLRSVISHEGMVIGELAVEWVDTAIYGYLVEMLILVLLLTVFWFFIGTLKQKTTLESQVEARTAELQKEIEERNVAEATLRKSEQQLRLSTEMAGVAVWEYDHIQNMMSRSSNHDALYGLEQQDTWTVDTFLRAIHPDDRELSTRIIEQSIAAGGPTHHSYDFRAIWPDGSIHWLETIGDVVERNAAGAATLVRGCLIDIADRKLAEEALIESEERARLMADLVTNSNQPIAIGFADGRLGRFNPAFCELVGYTEKELQTTDWATDLTPPEWLPMERDVLAKLERTGEPVRYEKEYIHKNGTHIPIELFVHLNRDQDGEPEYYFAFITDITERKKASEALQRSEATLRKAQEVAHLGSWKLDLATERFTLSDEAYHMYGQEPREEGLSRADFMEWVHPDDRAYGVKLFEALLADGEATFEYRAIRSGGEVRWITGRGITSFDPAGKPLKMFGFQQDITERKQVEEDLRQSERRLILSQETAHLGTWELDLSTTRITWTDELYRIFGIALGEIELTYESVLERVYPEDREKKDQVIQQIVKQGSARFEYRIVRPNGDIRWISGEGETTCDETGNPVRIFGIAQDITDRKRVENKLKEKEESLRLMFEQAPMPICMNSLSDGAFISANPAYEKLIGYTTDELRGMTFFDITHPDDRPKNKDLLNDISTQQAAGFKMEKRYRCKDGVQIVVMVHATAVHDAEGTPLLGLAVVEDITELKRAKEELLESHNQLERRVEERTTELQSRKNEADMLNRAMVNLLQDLKETNRGLEAAKEALQNTNSELEAFSYSVSHDLRAPLRHIDGFIKLLLKREKEHLDDTSARYLNTIAQSSSRMGQLIDDLLAFSRTGRTEMHRHPVDLNKMVQATVQEFSSSTKNRHIVWNISNLPSVIADSSLIRQVWTNLIDNAIKYTAPRDEARIEIGATDPGCENNTTKTTFYIRDNGAGFDPQYAHKLFGVFQRLHRDDEFAGTGIGLATVRRIVHRHGGQVWAEGKIDEGATFYFTLKTQTEKSSNE